MKFVLFRLVFIIVFTIVWLYLRGALRRHILWGNFLKPPVSFVIDGIILFIIFFRYILKLPFPFLHGEFSNALFSVGYFTLSTLGMLLGILLFLDIYSIARSFWDKSPKTDEGRRNVLKAASIGSTTLLSSSVGLAQAISPKVVKDEIKIPNLSPDLEGLKILQLSDVHIGPFMNETFVAQLRDMGNEQKPDLVFLTGDLIDGHVENIGWQLEGFKDIKSTYGTYMIAGNHEYYWDVGKWIKQHQSFGYKTLLNEGDVITIGNTKLGIAGIADSTAKRYDLKEVPDMKKCAESIAEADLKILLAHRPRFADEATKHGFDLQFSGHTHGGQTYPFVPLVALVQKYLAGLYKVGDMQLYVSRGAGFWGPPLRLGVTPEVNVITLKKA